MFAHIVRWLGWFSLQCIWTHALMANMMMTTTMAFPYHSPKPYRRLLKSLSTIAKPTYGDPPPVDVSHPTSASVTCIPLDASQAQPQRHHWSWLERAEQLYQYWLVHGH